MEIDKASGNEDKEKEPKGKAMQSAGYWTGLGTAYGEKPIFPFILFKISIFNK